MVYAVHEQLMKSHVNNLAVDQLCMLADVLYHVHGEHSSKVGVCVGVEVGVGIGVGGGVGVGVEV